MLQLRPHQQEVVDQLSKGFADGHRCQLLYAPTGFGKTEVAMSIMRTMSQKYKKTAMVLDRIVLVEQTSLRMGKYGIQHGVMQAQHWRYKPMERIQICSAQTLEKRQIIPDINLMIIDECFVAGTKIATPFGPTDIDLVRCGDAVYNQCGIGIVEAVSIKPANKTLRLEFDDGTVTECTENHPFFTELGWKAAGKLEVGAHTFSIEGMCLLWERVQALDSLDRNGEDKSSNARAELEYANQLLQVLLEEIEESNEQSSNEIEGQCKAKRDQAQAYKTWRKRAIAAFATAGAASCAWNGLGVGVSSENKDGQGLGLSIMLQAGLSKSNSYDGDRDRRIFSHNIESQESGQKENKFTCFPRLVNISVIEREGIKSVFNLQVSGHPSYFADGRLVHNCHIQRKGTIKLIKDNPHIFVIGLTATPFTKGLGDIYTNVVGASATGDLVSKGWLTSLKVFIAKEIDMTGAKKVAGEWSADEVSTRGMQITGDIVSEWVKKTHQIYGGPRKTIVFCSGVEHGRDLVKEFAAAGYNFVSISYKEDDEFKRATIEDFSKPDTTIHGLIATDILTRGFDVPDVMIAVSARPFSKSFSSHVQQLGRVMRPYEGKEYGVWLDHSGNYLRFRDDWDKLYNEGVTELQAGGSEVAKKELTEREKKQSQCPKCSSLWTSPTRTCNFCGFERPNMREVVNVPGELRELEAANRKLQINNQEFYSHLLYYAKAKGYKDGWAAFKYKEKFHVMPNGLKTTPVKPTVATLGWIKSRVIAYAKSKVR